MADDDLTLSEKLRIEAIHSAAQGDHDGAAEAVRVAQEIEDAAAKNTPREKN